MKSISVRKERLGKEKQRTCLFLEKVRMKTWFRFILLRESDARQFIVSIFKHDII